MARYSSTATTCLIVPGLHGSGRDHWQTLWEEERDDCARVDLGYWSAPIRNVWISRLDQAVTAARTPVVIVAHSLGCLATVWWATLLGANAPDKVRGAMLVAPPDVAGAGRNPLLGRFSPEPGGPLPFPSILVASRNDRYATFERQREMAAKWGSRLVDVGDLGHINAESAIGSWLGGQELLDRLIEETVLHPRPDVVRTTRPRPER